MKNRLNRLNNIAKHILTSAPDSTKSWFLQVKKLCSQYNLPHPISLLDNPYQKEPFKILVSNKVLDYWQTKLRNHSQLLPSLSMFHPEYMSLKTPHPLLTTAGSNPFQVNKCELKDCADIGLSTRLVPVNCVSTVMDQ